MKHKLVNLTALATIQISNAVLPLVIFPFALGVIGSDLYAKVVLSEALSLFLLAIVLYSFEVDGVLQVVGLDPKVDAKKISHIFSGITYLRLSLFICCAPIFILVALLIDKQMVVLALFWALVPLSYAIQPNWLYQGLERNTPVAIITVLSRICILFVVLNALAGPTDYLVVPIAIGGFYLLGSICSLLYAMHQFGIRFVSVSATQLRQMLWSGKDVFLGNLSVTLYRDVNVIILSAMGSLGAGIAAYSMAEKLVKAIQASIRPLNQLFFPRAIRVARAAGSPGRPVFHALLKLTLPQLAVLAVLVLVLVLGYITIGTNITWVQRIENADYVASLVLLMSAGTFFGVSNFMFGSAGLNALGERRYLFFAILSTGLISLAISTLLVSVAGPLGAAISFVLAEIILLAIIARRYFQ